MDRFRTSPLSVSCPSWTASTVLCHHAARSPSCPSHARNAEHNSVKGMHSQSSMHAHSQHAFPLRLIPCASDAKCSAVHAGPCRSREQLSHTVHHVVNGATAFSACIIALLSPTNVQQLRLPQLTSSGRHRQRPAEPKPKLYYPNISHYTTVTKLYMIAPVFPFRCFFELRLLVNVFLKLPQLKLDFLRHTP